MKFLIDFITSLLLYRIHVKKADLNPSIVCASKTETIEEQEPQKSLSAQNFSES